MFLGGRFGQRRSQLVTAVALLLAAPGAWASSRDAEIAECRPGEIVTWNDGVDRPASARKLRFAYRHEGAPFWFSRRQVETAIERAASAWSACGISTQVIDASRHDVQAPGDVMVRWNDAGSRGNFGLAHLGERSLSLGAEPFRQLKRRNPTYDSAQTLQMVISHEMGHFFGLMAHSRRCVDVLSYYKDGKGATCFARDPAAMGGVVEYRHTLPTACDIARCKAANGQRPGVPDPR